MKQNHPNSLNLKVAQSRFNEYRMMEWWNDGMVEYWNGGKLKNGMLEHWN